MNAKFAVTGIKPKEKGRGNAIKKAADLAESIHKKKGGRPKKTEAEQLTKKITVNCTQAEYDDLQNASQETYLAVSVLIRKCLKDADIIK
jgi:hypothetical protein